MNGFQRLFSLGSQTLAIFQIATLPSPMDGDRTETLAKDFGPFQSNYNPAMKLYLHHLLLAAVLATSPSISAGEPVSLLSGNLTDHWTTTGNWSLEDGIASLTPREGEKGWARWSAYLWSTKQYGDFEIEFDYKVQEKGNSGFYFRVGDKDDPVKQGIEVQIFDSGSWPKEKPLNDHDSGGIIPRIPPTKRAAKLAGEWNHFKITSQANQLTVVLNGEVVNKVDLTKGELGKRPAKGWIGFQDHALPLQLKNIVIKEL